MKWFLLVLVILIAVVGIAQLSMRRQTHDLLTFENFKSYADEFHVTILEAKSAPGSFAERVRIRCESDMEVGIEVIDLKETGIHETHGTNGTIFYRVGNPFKVGQSGLVHADGKSSNCEIFYSVSTTLSNTIWHSKISVSATNAFSHGEDTDVLTRRFPFRCRLVTFRPIGRMRIGEARGFLWPLWGIIKLW